MSIQAAVGDYVTTLDAWLGRLNQRYAALGSRQRRKVDQILGDRKPERSEAYALAMADAIRRSKGRTYTPTSELAIPWLPEALQDVALQARCYGLAISHFNSGSAYNENNGTRIFLSNAAEVGHFDGDYLAHCNTLPEIHAFLAGYKAGRARKVNAVDIGDLIDAARQECDRAASHLEGATPESLRAYANRLENGFAPNARPGGMPAEGLRHASEWLTQARREL